jgi:3D (Asp-Asp-Asp) domain-containing protein
MSTFIKTGVTALIFSLLLPLSATHALTINPVQTPKFREVSLVATAYYSPLPNQKFYLRGDYEQEIILNGRGTHGASGKPVFEGMIAAPKNYGFGTKIWIEGLGVGSVEDRGGAIVNAGVRGHAYDRVDIWMGSGEVGLARSLAWGKRTVKARIYEQKSTKVAFSTSHLSQAKLANSVAKIAAPSKSSVTSKVNITAPQVVKSTVQIASLDDKIVYFDRLRSDLRWDIHLSSVTGVRNTQESLRKLGFFTGKSTGRIGPATLKALRDFEKSVGIEGSRTVFTESTQTALINALIARGIDSVAALSTSKEVL